MCLHCFPAGSVFLFRWLPLLAVQVKAPIMHSQWFVLLGFLLPFLHVNNFMFFCWYFSFFFLPCLPSSLCAFTLLDALIWYLFFTCVDWNQTKTFSWKKCVFFVLYVWYIYLTAAFDVKREVLHKKTNIIIFFVNFVFCLFSVSSAEKTPDWSDEDTVGNPFSTNGDSNPFEEEPESPVVSVPVKALYDYEGQEQDELSFKAGV